jgi:hypothetical protein
MHTIHFGKTPHPPQIFSAMTMALPYMIPSSNTTLLSLLRQTLQLTSPHMLILYSHVSTSHSSLLLFQILPLPLHPLTPTLIHLLNSILDLIIFHSQLLYISMHPPPVSPPKLVSIGLKLLGIKSTLYCHIISNLPNIPSPLTVLPPSSVS